MGSYPALDVKPKVIASCNFEGQLKILGQILSYKNDQTFLGSELFSREIGDFLLGCIGGILQALEADSKTLFDFGEVLDIFRFQNHALQGFEAVHPFLKGLDPFCAFAEPVLGPFGQMEIAGELLPGLEFRVGGDPNPLVFHKIMKFVKSIHGLGTQVKVGLKEHSKVAPVWFEHALGFLFVKGFQFMEG